MARIATDMAKKIPFITPVGIARYPHITEPDSTGKFADNKYKAQLIVSKKDAKPLIDSLKQTAKALGVSKLPFKDDPEDSDNVIFVAKSKFKPAVFDAKRAEVKSNNLRIGGGSKIRMAGIVFPYDTGLSLQLKQVQIVEIVSGANAMFDEVEGSFDASDYADDDTPTFGDDMQSDGLDL
jgi:hypothetical protein